MKKETEITIEEITETAEVINEEETIMNETEMMNEVEATEVTTKEKKNNAAAFAVGLGIIALPLTAITVSVMKKRAAKKAAVKEENPTVVNEDDKTSSEEKLAAYREALANANAKIKELESELDELTETDSEPEK